LTAAENRYLLRTNLSEIDPKILWEYYLQLVEGEGAFKLLTDDLSVRPIFHHKKAKIEAPIFVALLSATTPDDCAIRSVRCGLLFSGGKSDAISLLILTISRIHLLPS
jgi:hypothetical protein